MSMEDATRTEYIVFLLRVWMKLETTHWPKVKAWVESQLNSELP